MVQELRGSDISVAEIAAELGRSARMVRKVLNGESSGEAYRTAITQLVTSGRVSNPPRRRRDAAGQPVPVRTKAGEATPTVRPEDPTPPTPPARGAFTTSTTFLGGGGRQHEITSPKSEGPGRERARLSILDRLRRGAKGQAHKDKRVKFRVAYSGGRTMEVGSKAGYRISDALARSRGEGDDPFAWLTQQGADRYPEDDLGDITGVTMTLWNAGDSEP